MGRGVRSGEDFCAVLLWGAKITRIININESLAHFTEATRVQLDIARKLTRQITSENSKVTTDALLDVLGYSLNKDKIWRSGSKTAVARAKGNASGFIEQYLPLCRKAFDHARAKRHQDACNAAQEAANGTDEPRVKGYIMQQLAEYMYHRDPVESFRILAKAANLNAHVTKPYDGLEYRRISAPANQAVASATFMKRFLTSDDLVIWAKGLLEDLAWDPMQTKRFEAAVKELGEWLGFASHRPGEETLKGPDNLWAVGNNQFFVIECKSGSAADQVSKLDLDQLSGSMNWFAEKYPPDAQGIPVIFHPKDRCVREATPHADTRVISEKEMSLLQNCLRDFAKSLAAQDGYKSVDNVKERLLHFNFTAATFLDKYATHMKRSG